MAKKIEELLNRQREINEEIETLTMESTKLTEEIHRVLLLKEKSASVVKSNVRQLVDEVLHQQGFKVGNGKIEGTQVVKAEKGTRTLLIGIRGSKFYEETHNAWYTLDGNSSEKIDFQVLGFVDSKGVESCVVLPNKVVMEMLGQVKVTNGGEYHIFLKGNDKNVIEVKSGMDLSEYINNLTVLK